MPPRVETTKDDMRTNLAVNPSPKLTRYIGLILFLGLGLSIEWLLCHYAQGQAASQKATTVVQGEKMRARLEGELNAVTIPSNALAGYWAIRRTSPDAEETQDILAEAYRHGQHVRNFAIAAGTRVTQVFPQDDGMLATGLDYRDQPKQWALIQHCIATHAPILATAAQPAQGMTYWVPISAGGQSWGLLVAYIDDSSLLSAAGLAQTGGEYRYALRAGGESGAGAGMILGQASLFDDPKAYVTESAIPGGSLKLAVKSVASPTPDRWNNLFRGLGWLFAALFAAQTVALLKLKRKLSGLALYDALTGLPSRHLFLDRLKQTIRRTKRNRGNFSVLFVNLDEFKSINANHDKKVGDMMLAGIGKRLLGSIRHCDTVTRWEGDEFLILLDACPPEQAKPIAENLRHKIELPVSYGDNELRIGASIGLATYPEDGHSLAALLKIAEARMREDKSRHIA